MTIFPYLSFLASPCLASIQVSSWSNLSTAHLLGNHPLTLTCCTCSTCTTSPYSQYLFHLVTLTMSPSSSAILGSSVQGGWQHTAMPWVRGNQAPLYGRMIWYDLVLPLLSAFSMIQSSIPVWFLRMDFTWKTSSSPTAMTTPN